MWIYIATGLVYVGYQILSGNYKQVLFVRRDLSGVWPMARHYFLFGPKPVLKEAYNPLQKHAYTMTIGLGVLSVLTGAAVAFPDHVGAAGLCVWPFGDGGPAWLEQLCLYVNGMEEGPGLPVGVI